MKEACRSLKLVRFFIFFSAGVLLHRFSRMNRKAILLIGLLTDFRGYLAAGQWLAPDMSSYCFCHADFADDADFFLLIILVPQISQIYTDFFWFFSFFYISLFADFRPVGLRFRRFYIVDNFHPKTITDFL